MPIRANNSIHALSPTSSNNQYSLQDSNQNPQMQKSVTESNFHHVNMGSNSLK